MRWSLLAVFLMAVLARAGVAQEVKDGKKSDKEQSKSVYEIAGKSFDDWVKELSSKDPSRRETAVRNVMAFGPEKAYVAVPILIAQLKKHTPSTPIDLSVRINGATALGVILGSAKDPDPKYVKDAVGILKGFLRDSQVIVRFRALQALPLLGSEARTAVKEIVVLVRDPDTWETRQAAIQALVALGGDSQNPLSPDVMTALNKSLSDSSHLVRFAALQAMGTLGAGADSATKAAALRNLELVAAKDPEPSLQMWAHMAMMTVKQEITSEHLAPVAKFLRNDDIGLRLQACNALALAGPKASKFASPALIEALSDPEMDVIVSSMVALVRMEAMAAVPTLQRMSTDGKLPEPLKKAAAEAANQIENSKKKIDDPKK